MKFFIVLALFGAAFANEEVEPVVLEEAPSPALEMVDLGHAFIPESVLLELGLDRSASDNEPQPVHFVNENGDVQSFVDDAPVDAPVDDSYARIAPGELESVRFVDFPEFDTSEFAYKVNVVESPQEEADAPDSPRYPGKIFPNPLMR